MKKTKPKTKIKDNNKKLIQEIEALLKTDDGNVKDIYRTGLCAIRLAIIAYNKGILEPNINKQLIRTLLILESISE